MPTYDYECLSCKHKFELFQKMTDAPIDKCPECNHKVRRLIGSGSGVIFKGSGFYATDYKKKSSKDDKPSISNTCPHAQKGCNGCKPS